MLRRWRNGSQRNFTFLGPSSIIRADSDRWLPFSPADYEGAEHIVAKRGRVQQPLERPGNRSVGARDRFNRTSQSLEEELHLHRVGQDDRVVIGFKRLFDNRGRSIKSNGLRGVENLTSLGIQPTPVLPLVSQPSHAWVIVPEADHATKIRTRYNHSASDLSHANQLGQEGLGFINMLEDVQRADTGEVLVWKGKALSLVNLAVLAEFARTRDIRLRDIDSIRVDSFPGQRADHLTDSTSYVQCAATRFERAQRFGVFAVESRIPASQKGGVCLVLMIVGFV